MRRARSGLIEADLGGGVIKQRIARRGGGRSGGFRTIPLLRREELAFFVHGFAKSDRDNLRRKEFSGLRKLAETGIWRWTPRVWWPCGRRER